MEKQIVRPIVTFTSEQIDFQLDKVESVTNWLLNIAKVELRTVAQLEYIFCSDNYLLEVNKQYLDHDYFTDIITFPLQDSPLEATIMISIERVRENAKIYKATFSNELHRVMVHGLLHLLDYKDSTNEEKKQMRTKENDCLAQRIFV